MGPEKLVKHTTDPTAEDNLCAALDKGRGWGIFVGEGGGGVLLAHAPTDFSKRFATADLYTDVFSLKFNFISREE